MGFSTGRKAEPTTTPAQTSGSNDRPPAKKPDYLLKVKDPETGKYVRVAGMWRNEERDSFSITLEEDVTLTSTKEERQKIYVFANDMDKSKFRK